MSAGAFIVCPNIPRADALTTATRCHLLFTAACAACANRDSATYRESAAPPEPLAILMVSLSDAGYGSQPRARRRPAPPRRGQGSPQLLPAALSFARVDAITTSRAPNNE